MGGDPDSIEWPRGGAGMNPVGQEEGRLGRRTESGRRRRSCPAALGEGRAATQGSRKLRAGARRAGRRTALAGPWGWREAKGSALHRWEEGSCHRDLPPGTAPRSHHQHPRLDPARQSPLPPATSALLPSLSLVIEVTTPALPIHATLGHPLHPLSGPSLWRVHTLDFEEERLLGLEGDPLTAPPLPPGTCRTHLMVLPQSHHSVLSMASMCAWNWGRQDSWRRAL